MAKHPRTCKYMFQAWVTLPTQTHSHRHTGGPGFPLGPGRPGAPAAPWKTNTHHFWVDFTKSVVDFSCFFNQSLCTVMEQTQVEPIGNSRYTHCMVTWRAMLCKDAYLIPLVPHLSWLAPLSGFTLDFIVSNRDITQHCTAAIIWRNHKQKNSTHYTEAV